MTAETFTVIGTTWLVAITGILGWAGRWILTNKDHIVQVIQAVREIRERVDEHDENTGLDPARAGYTALPDPKPADVDPVPINPLPSTPQSKIKTTQLSP